MVQIIAALEDRRDNPKSVCLLSSSLLFPIQEKSKLTVTHELTTRQHQQQLILEQEQKQQRQTQEKRFWKQRDIIDTFADILQTISLRKENLTGCKLGIKGKTTNTLRHGAMLLTRVKRAIRTSTCCFKKYIAELTKYGLIRIDTHERKTSRTRSKTKKKHHKIKERLVRLTDKGLDFLQVYRRVREFLAV